jgi:hypothetical protein
MRTRGWSLLAVAASVSASAPAGASSHREAPAITSARLGDEFGDITDLYAWMAPDAQHLNLVLGWNPDSKATSKFGKTLQWAFHVTSKPAFESAEAKDVDIVCQFDEAQHIDCRLGDERVTGDATGPQGLASASGRLRVFDGLRNDPFFFNLSGFHEVVRQVGQALPDATRDAAGCPSLDAALGAQLASGAGGAPARDDFGGQNVLIIAVQVDKALVTPGGPVIGVWASTHRKPSEVAP